jgi:hypothetical protein
MKLLLPLLGAVCVLTSCTKNLYEDSPARDFKTVQPPPAQTPSSTPVHSGAAH